MTEDKPLPLVPRIDEDGYHLVQLTLADVPAIYAGFVGDAEIQRWSSLGRAKDLAGVEEWARSRASPDRVEWTIRLSDETVAGRVALHRVDLEDGTAEIGYGLFRAFRGRGLGRRVARRVTTYGFTNLGLRRIILQHAVENTRSCGVATACGYALEGTLRQSLGKTTGGWEDAHLHARLSTD
jgi:[ribosomal protein S5]-alanine N-acetyltransferase